MRTNLGFLVRYKVSMPTTPPSNTCLFCGRDATGSGESHIIPAAVGNTVERQGDRALILPSGAVCNQCNQRFGGKVESSFLQDDVGVTARIRGVPNRSGRHVTFAITRGAMSVNENPEPGRVKQLRVSPSAPHPPGWQPPKDPIRLDLKFEVHPKHHYTSALLSKMTVEFVAFNHGFDAARHVALDHHRNNALRSTPTAFLPYHRGRAGTWDQCILHLDLRLGILVFAFGGVQMVMPVGCPDVYLDAPGFVLHRPQAA
jgi:hypothetical protein